MARTRRTRTAHPGVKLIEIPRAGGRKSWAARWTDPETGKAQQQSLTKLQLRNAAARRDWAIHKSRALAKREAEIAAGAPKKTETPVGEAVADYLAHVAATLKPGTRDIYGEDVAHFERWAQHQAIRYVEDLRAGDIASFSEHLARARRQSPSRQGRRGERRPSKVPLSTPTINRRIRSCRTLLLRWRRLGLTPRLTKDDISDALTLLREPKPAPKILRGNTIAKLLAAAMRHDAETFAETREEHRGAGVLGCTPRYQPIAPFIAVTLLTGCRVGMTLGLRWDQVDLEALNADGDVVGEIRLGTETKTKAARQIDLAVSPALRELLTALKLQAGGEPYVFGGSKPQPKTSVDAGRKRLQKTYGAPKFTWQMLRKTCGSYLTCSPGIFGGASVFLSARQLGHSVQVAEKHYLGTLRGIPREARSLEAAMRIEAELGKLLARVSGGAGDQARRIG